MVSFRLFAAWLWLGAVGVPGVLSGQEYAPSEMRICYFRDGAEAADPTSPSGKVARVGRDWSIQWFMESAGALPPIDYSGAYDVMVRCRGAFRLGMYGSERSGFLIPYRSLELPEDQWREIRIGREVLDRRDYLTTDGVDRYGAIAQVTLIAHPVTAEERELEALGLPGIEIDADEAASFSLTGSASEPIRLALWMPQDSFCPTPAAAVTARTRSGQLRRYPCPVGRGELVIPASPEDPVTALTIHHPGRGRARDPQGDDPQFCRGAVRLGSDAERIYSGQQF